MNLIALATDSCHTYQIQRPSITEDEVDGALDEAVCEQVTASLVVECILCS